MPKRTLRRKRKVIQDPTEGIIEAEVVEEKSPVRIVKKYPKQKCAVEGCIRNAVGKTDVCKKHGGDPIVKENLLLPSEVPTAMMSASKYQPAYHPMAYIGFSREGLSEIEIAAKFEVSIGTLRGWAEKFADFNMAYEVGASLHEAWWLAEGKKNLDNRGYNTGLFKFLTSNKLGYSDKMESKNLNVNAGVLLVPGQMDKDAWEQSVRGEG